MERPFNLDELLARCVGRLDLAQRVLDKFMLHFGQDMDRLEQNLELGDTEELIRIAHCMKGASASVAASGLLAQVTDIEDLARRNEVDALPPRLVQLRDEWSRFSDSVTAMGAAPKRCEAN